MLRVFQNKLKSNPCEIQQSWKIISWIKFSFYWVFGIRFPLWVGYWNKSFNNFKCCSNGDNLSNWNFKTFFVPRKSESTNIINKWQDLKNMKMQHINKKWKIIKKNNHIVLYLYLTVYLQKTSNIFLVFL